MQTDSQDLPQTATPWPAPASGGEPEAPAPQAPAPGSSGSPTVTEVEQEALPTLTATLPPLDLDALPQKAIDLETVDWKPVSPRYVSLCLLTRSIWTLLLVAITALPALFTALLGWWNWAPWAYIGLPALVLVLRVLSLILTTRQVRALGYSERADHLLIRRGLMFRSITTIPYGRIQYVDMESGPLESQRKLARITIKTAADSSSLPGLDIQDATRLREVLTDLSDARMVGL